MRTRSGHRVRWLKPPTLPQINAPGAWQALIGASAGRALAAWSAPDCTGLRYGDGIRARKVLARNVHRAGPPRFRISFVETRADDATYDPAWTEITTSPWGRIKTVHVQLNTRRFVDTVRPADLDAVLLHEIGHALGVDHSHRRHASMWSYLSRRHPKRVLSGDDKDAICALYPTGAFSTEASQAGLGWLWLLPLLLLPPGGWWAWRRRVAEGPTA